MELRSPLTSSTETAAICSSIENGLTLSHVIENPTSSDHSIIALFSLLTDAGGAIWRMFFHVRGDALYREPFRGEGHKVLKMFPDPCDLI